MKAYRRGLQDYEYCWLLKQAGKEKAADDLMAKIIPAALTAATGETVDAAAGDLSATAERTGKPLPAPIARPAVGPPWSTDFSAWYQLREDLAAELLKK